LAGFLGENNAAQFTSELWKIMLEAQTCPQGIPRTLIEAKKKELEQEKQKPPNARQTMRWTTICSSTSESSTAVRLCIVFMRRQNEVDYNQ
jgi:hypothetical protein